MKLYYKIYKADVVMYMNVSVFEVNRYVDKGFQVKRVW